MKKNILAALFSVAIFSMMGVSSLAQGDAEVCFTGNRKLEYRGVTDQGTEVNLGNAFENVVPGETRVQTITLKNENERTVDFYMSSEVVKALEEGTATARGAGYEIQLTVGETGAPAEELTVLYDSSVGGYDDNSMASAEGIGEMNEALQDYILIDTMEKGETKEVKLTIYFDGEAMDNAAEVDYSQTQGQLAFQFQVGYEDPTGITRIVREVEDDGEIRYVRQLVEVLEEAVPLGAVETGDGAMIGLGAGILGMGILFLICGKKKKVEEEA